MKNDKGISKFDLGNIIIASIMALNFILVCIIGAGLVENVLNSFFEFYLKISLTIIPFGCIIATIVMQKYYGNDRQYFKKDYFLYLPFCQSILFIMLYSVKFAFQLDRSVLKELIVIAFAFIILQVVFILMLFENEYKYKKYCILSILAYFTFLLFIILIMMLTYDYSIII